MLGDNTGVYRIDGLFLSHQNIEFHRYKTRPDVMRPSTSHTLRASSLHSYIYIAAQRLRNDLVWCT